MNHVQSIFRSPFWWNVSFFRFLNLQRYIWFSCFHFLAISPFSVVNTLFVTEVFWWSEIWSLFLTVCVFRYKLVIFLLPLLYLFFVWFLVLFLFRRVSRRGWFWGCGLMRSTFQARKVSCRYLAGGGGGWYRWSGLCLWSCEFFSSASLFVVYCIIRRCSFASVRNWFCVFNFSIFVLSMILHSA